MVDNGIERWYSKSVGEEGKKGFMSSDLEQQQVPAKQVPRNRLIMLRYLEGQSAETIATHFGLQTSTISGILNSLLVRQEMEQISQNATGRIQNLTDEALDAVRDTMRGEMGSELRFKAATKLLDYNPELNPRKSEARDLVEGLGEGMIRALSKQIRGIEENEKENKKIDISPNSKNDLG